MTFTEQIGRILDTEPSDEKRLISSISGDAVIYGAGVYGKRAHALLARYGKKVLYFIDDNPRGPFLDLPVYPLDSLPPNDKSGVAVIIDFFLFSQKGYESLIESLAARGFQRENIVAWGGFLCEDMGISYHQDKKEILSAASLLKDEESRKVWKGCLEARWRLDLSYFPAPSTQLQYFDQEIPRSAGFGRFIDCGAYIGDTYQAILEHHIPVNSYVGFEPDLDQFRELSSLVQNTPCEGMTHILFPCAAHERSCTAGFQTGGGGGAVDASSAESRDFAVCVAIDDALPDFAPTFIKMDVEGSEVSALRGSRETIRRYRPDLAICLYHKTSDLWNVPNLLHDLVPAYRFFVRSYRLHGEETVLYACI